MKTLDILPVRVVRISMADGAPCEGDWRNKYVGTVATLLIRESEKKFPGKKCVKLELIADRVDGVLECWLGAWMRTDCGELIRSEGSIVLSTADGIYEFEEIVGEELEEYDALLDDLASGKGRFYRKNAPHRFERGDRVEFDVTDIEGVRHVFEGTVEIIDYRGRESSCFKGCDWSYDVMASSVPEPWSDGSGICLFKHIPECDLRRVFDGVR